jgi:anti-sigma-K factor RskA
MIDDEQLTLFFYGDELDREQTRRIELALQDDAALAARYEAVSNELSALAVVPATPPSAQFSAALHEALCEAAETETAAAPAPRSWAGLAMAAGVCVVALVAGFALRSPTPEPVAGQAADAQSIAVARSVQSHLVASRLQLVRFESAGAQERGDLLMELMARNRAAARSASRSGNTDLARVLRAMHLLLDALAQTLDSGGELDPALLQQIEFELNAMLTKLDVPTSDLTTSF